MQQPTAVMRIEIPVFDGFDELDAVGPYEVLRTASQISADASLDVALVGAHGPGQVVAAHGLRLSVTEGLGRPDALIVPGGGWTGRTPRGTWHEVQAGTLPARLAELAPACRWTASVCRSRSVGTAPSRSRDDSQPAKETNPCRTTSTAPPTAPTDGSTHVTCTPSPPRLAPPRSS
jgi:putative intracellular protease/amidase